MQTTPGGVGGGAGGAAPMFAGIFILLLALIMVAAMVALWGMIFSKAGYSFWMALLMLVPIANLVWLIVFAVSKWPIHQELERYRSQMGYSGGGFPVGQGYAPPQEQSQGYPPPPPMR